MTVQLHQYPTAALPISKYTEVYQFPINIVQLLHMPTLYQASIQATVIQPALHVTSQKFLPPPVLPTIVTFILR